MFARRFPTAVTVSVVGLAWVMVFAVPSHAQGPTSTKAAQPEDVAASTDNAVRQAERLEGRFAG